MAPPPDPTPEAPSARRLRWLLIPSGAVLGLAVAWLFSLVSGIPLPAWEAAAAAILGALLGFSASLPASPPTSKSPPGP